MLVVTSTLPQQQAWACCGILQKVAPKPAKAFMVRNHIVGFPCAATALASRRCSRPPSASDYRTMMGFSCRRFQRVASSQSRSGSNTGGEMEDDDDEEDEDDEDEGSAGQFLFEENLEIMMRAAMNLFRKYSARTIRAIREISPPAISTELIAFGVKGAFGIGILWVSKVLLEVFCSIATYVFAGVVVVRFAWSLVVSAQPGDDSNWSPQGN